MKYSWLVDKYIEGDLKGEELRRFEEKLSHDPELAKEIDNIRHLVDFIRSQHNVLKKERQIKDPWKDSRELVDHRELERDLEDLRVRKSAPEDDVKAFDRKLKEARKRFIKSGEKKSGTRRLRPAHIRALAASLAIMLGVGGALLYSGMRGSDPAELFEQYYRPYRTDMVSRSIAPAENDRMSRALVAYQEGRYTDALGELEGSPETGTEYNRTAFLRGLCYIELGEPAMAIKNMETLTSDPQYRDYALWYAGLSMLLTATPEEAAQYLDPLTGHKNHFRTKARKVLKELN